MQEQLAKYIFPYVAILIYVLFFLGLVLVSIQLENERK